MRTPTSRIIRDETGKVIGEVTSPACGRFFAHSIHRDTAHGSSAETRADGEDRCRIRGCRVPMSPNGAPGTCGNHPIDRRAWARLTPRMRALVSALDPAPDV